MGKGLFYTLLGIFASLIVAGVGILSTSGGTTPASGGTAAAVAIILIGIGIIALVLINIYELRRGLLERLSNEYSRLNTISESLAGQLQAAATGITDVVQDHTRTLEHVAGQLGVQNDARFVPTGFIGLQRESIELENASVPGRETPLRMGVFGHLPSHVRTAPLDRDTGAKLYHNWEPPHLIEQYIQLVNDRRAAMLRFLEDGGVIREAYEQGKIEQYIEQRHTFHDQIDDPLDEIEDRLRALRGLLDRDNYYLYFIEATEDRTTPYYMLKPHVGLLIDLRTTEPERHLTRSIDGLVSTSAEAMDDFQRKFERIVHTRDKGELIGQVEKYIDQVRQHAK